MWSTGLLAIMLLINGCSLNRPVLLEEVAGLGHFEFREPVEGMEGIVVGAPHGRTDTDSDKLARAISDRTGAGFVIAYGFKSKRLGVSQPVVRSQPYPASFGPLQRGSVFKDYKRILQTTAKGDLDVYIGVHRSNARKVADRIEVATSGLTFEEAKALKAAYNDIRDRLVQEKAVPRLPMAIEPLDSISWRATGVKHHGVLLIAERGINFRLPEFRSSPLAENLYTEILSQWVLESLKLLRENPLGLPQIQVKLTNFGRFDLIESRKHVPGVVIGAPHGSYDEYTAEVVKRISFRTGLAAVIAKGFTPTEAGGWRINVNRPTEKIPYSENSELHSQRALQVYRSFRDLVFEASGRDLNLYIDIHQYNTDNKIQVATVGISAEEARIIKMFYREIRDRSVQKKSGVQAVDLVIEPVDQVEIGAWAAKAQGILSLARKALHFELPADLVLEKQQAREAYTRILSDLLIETTSLIPRGRNRAVSEVSGEKAR